MIEYVTVWVDDLPDLKRGEEIVRCSDCVWSKPDQSDHEHRELHCNMWIADVSAEGFCSRGKRNDGFTPKNDISGTEVNADDADAASVSVSRFIEAGNETGSADSREKLEADVRKHYAYSTTTLMYPPSANKTTDMLSALPVDTVIGWLDRQAAITERETLHSHPMCAGSDACPALNRPIGESADRETPDTAGIGALKDEIRDFDVWNVAYEIYCAGGYVDNGNEPNPPTDGIRELLDRQAAITEREVKLRELHKFEENHRWHVRSIEEVNQQLNERIKELEDKVRRQAESIGEWELRCESMETERDEWKTKCETCEFAYKQADAERKRYSEQIDELRAEIATLKEHRAANMERLHELTDANAELRKYRDEWKGLAEKYRADSIAAQAETERYRAKLGDVLDAIHEAERAVR